MDSDCLQNYVSLAEEMRSYETLYGMRSQTQKTIHERFHKAQLRPSQLLQKMMAEQLFHEELSSLYEKVASFLSSLTVHFSVCVHGAFQYPDTIRSARYPAELFYYRGNIGLVEDRCVSIVGSRKATEAGVARARQLAKGLVEKDYTIVSGLAAGIDTAAMTETVACGGRTIGVIGTPISESYPRENTELQETVAAEHLLLSHVPFYRYRHEPYISRRNYFPQRNELMAALSVATVIVEASDTSGSLTQARACLQQGKKLFILNSCFENTAISWPHTYEKKGAIRVKTWDDIWQHLKDAAPNGGSPVEKD